MAHTLADDIWMDAQIGDYNYPELEAQCDKVRSLEQLNAELLEALKEITPLIFGKSVDCSAPTKAVKKAQAAIAKAEGE